MINTIIIGIFIGLCVSVPTGPLGVLCIQRTISRGKTHGLMTGLGATTSDLIYALLVSLGMSYIIQFVESHQSAIQIVGSLIIGLFGLHLFLKQPHPEIVSKGKRKLSKSELANDYISALLLCLSNPLIIFLFIGLFAQFSVIEPGNTLKTAVCFASIFIGALSWWLTLTLIVGKFRRHFGLKGLQILNKTTGGILIIIAIGTIAYSIVEYYTV